MSTVNRDPIAFIRKRGYQLLVAAGLVLVVTVFAVVLAMRPTKTEVAFDYARKVVVMRDAINAQPEAWYAMDRAEPTLSKKLASKEQCESSVTEGKRFVCGQGDDLKSLLDDHLKKLVN